MRTIMLMNAKGGCGKTTLATNIATWFADEGATVALADYDPQGSSLDWLQARKDYDGVPEIEAIDATSAPVKPAKGTDFLILDAPAGTHGSTINEMLKRVDTLLVPVLPSARAKRACERFLKELLASGRVSRKMTRIGLVANRVRENTVAYGQLMTFLQQLNIPVLSHLRESQNYIRSAERGLGLFELAPSMVWHDLEQWDPILDWLEER